MSEAAEFAVDAAVAPCRVLPRHLQDEPAQLGRCRGPPGWSVRLGPVAGDASAVPAQQGVGCDEPTGSSGAGERGCYRAEQRPVVVAEVGPIDLALKHGELVA